MQCNLRLKTLVYRLCVTTSPISIAIILNTFVRHTIVADCGNLVFGDKILGVALTELTLAPGYHAIEVLFAGINFVPEEVYLSDDESYNVCGAQMSSYSAELLDNLVFINANVLNDTLTLKIMVIGER